MRGVSRSVHSAPRIGPLLLTNVPAASEARGTVTSHLQRLLDDAVRTELAPLGEMIEQAVGGLNDEQVYVVGAALQRALRVGLRVAIVEATAQIEEQGYQVDLVLDIEPDPPPS